jgi:hypothetical protein
MGTSTRRAASGRACAAAAARGAGGSVGAGASGSPPPRRGLSGRGAASHSTLSPCGYGSACSAKNSPSALLYACVQKAHCSADSAAARTTTLRVGTPTHSHGSDAMPTEKAAAAAPGGATPPGKDTCSAVEKRFSATNERSSRWLKWNVTLPAGASTTNAS